MENESSSISSHPQFEITSKKMAKRRGKFMVFMQKKTSLKFISCFEVLRSRPCSQHLEKWNGFKINLFHIHNDHLKINCVFWRHLLA